MCSFQRTLEIPEVVFELRMSPSSASKKSFRFLRHLQMVGVTGFEPVTLRLSSACSNQLSYTPESSSGCGVRNAEFQTPRSALRIPHWEVGGAEEIRTPDL